MTFFTTVRRFFLFAALLLSTALTASAQRVVINEIANEPSSDLEWFELVATDNVDMRGYGLADFSSAGNPQDTLFFTDNALWSNVAKGTIVLVIASNVALSEDTDPSDGVLIVKTSNATYLQGNELNVAGSSDAVQVLDAEGSHIHGISWGSDNSGTLPNPKAHVGISISSGNSIGFFGTTQLSNFNSSFFVKTFDSTTPAAGNDAQNAAFITDLFLSERSVPRILVNANGNEFENGQTLTYSRLGGTQTITVTNSGNETLNISELTVSGEGFSTDAPSAPIEILPAESISFTITLSIQEGVESYNGTLFIDSDAFIEPRFTLDLASRSSLTQEDTFEVVTWNIEWFGSDSRGPRDEGRQRSNVASVMRNMDADLYALQEITSEEALRNLVSSLDGYRGFIADYISQSQKLAYIYKTATVDSVSSFRLTSFQEAYDWAFRLPYVFEINFRIGNEVTPLTIINLHAKANTGSSSDRQESYNRRADAAASLYQFIQNDRPNEEIIIAGDYNDDVDVSIYNNLETPYDEFTEDDVNFRILSEELTDAGEQSTVGFDDMIDHITITDELFDFYVSSSVDVFDTGFISNYGSTTSDHYPVWSTFDFSSKVVSNEAPSRTLPASVSLKQNYPNPFNPSTTIGFELNRSSTVSLTIFDILGRRVSTPVQRQRYSAGKHNVVFNASNMTSGVYVYRLSLANGEILTRKMTLIK